MYDTFPTLLVCNSSYMTLCSYKGNRLRYMFFSAGFWKCVIHYNYRKYIYIVPFNWDMTEEDMSLSMFPCLAKKTDHCVSKFCLNLEPRMSCSIFYVLSILNL